MSQQADTLQRIQGLSNEELSELMTKCQELIAQGTAKTEDYETFVLCQKELSRRTWS